MATAKWRGAELAKSDATVQIEGNHYFPPDSIQSDYFEKSETRSTCPWKGEAHYYHVRVDGELNRDAAWYYPEPKEAARQIRNHVAFWRGVKVED